MTDLVSIPRPDGTSCPAFVAEPATTANAGIVLVQEWWGLNDQIKGLANRLAAQGYLVVVPDLYRGKITTDGDEANHLMGSLDFMDATKEDLQGCTTFLKSRGAAKVGLSGFCMGGALTILGAVHLADLTAAVCFYGIPPKEAADPAAIRVPIQFHFATQDDWCTPAAVGALEETVKSAGVDHELFRYEAQHAFMNEARPEVHDAKAAQTAWDRATAFWSKHLR